MIAADDHHVTANAHVRDFNDSLTAGLQDSTGVHLIHTAEPSHEQVSTLPVPPTTDAPAKK